MGRVTDYSEFNLSGAIQYQRYGIVHDLRGQVIAEKGRTLLAKSGGGYDTLYTHTVNNYSATGTGAASPAIYYSGQVGSSTGSILYYSETKNWLNGSAALSNGQKADAAISYTVPMVAKEGLGCDSGLRRIRV